ncbi:MAG: hypothetical protein WBA17_16040 [Saprospiraceae bacterium]
MTTSDPIDSGFTSSTLQLNGTTGTNLRTAGIWARFVGIVGLIVGGLFALGVVIFFVGSIFIGQDDFLGVGSQAGLLSLVLFFYVAVILFSVYLAWLSFDFGRRAIRAVDQGHQASLDRAFASLKTLYICTGGLVILYIVIMFLSVFLGLAGFSSLF